VNTFKYSGVLDDCRGIDGFEVEIDYVGLEGAVYSLSFEGIRSCLV